VATPSESPSRLAIVVPLKGFATAKDRLSGALSPAEREALALRLATRVLTVARTIADADVIVVSDDERLLEWSSTLGAIGVRQSSVGLNGAVSDARDEATRRGCGHVLITHGDLVDPTPLVELCADLDRSVVTLVSDRHQDGTNVLALPIGIDFDTHYGRGSFRAHLDEAARRGIAVSVVVDGRLALDVDEPADLDFLQES
jgi:2-phospho-L-lactate guanylyltransferase